MGITPDLITLNTILGGAIKSDIATAEILLKQLKGFGLTPDVVTYSLLVKGHAFYNKDMQTAKGYVQQMMKCELSCEEDFFAVFNSLRWVSDDAAAMELLRHPRAMLSTRCFNSVLYTVYHCG